MSVLRQLVCLLLGLFCLLQELLCPLVGLIAALLVGIITTVQVQPGGKLLQPLGFLPEMIRARVQVIYLSPAVRGLDAVGRHQGFSEGVSGGFVIKAAAAAQDAACTHSAVTQYCLR